MPRYTLAARLMAALLAVSGLCAGQDAPQIHFSVVHAFQGGADGAFPGYGALIPDSSGNLYGTKITR